MKTPALIGTLIFGSSLLVVAIAALRLDFIFKDLAKQEYFELFFIWLSGIVGGIGLGYGSRESFGYNDGNTATIIGGLGLVGSMVISVWMFVMGSPPLPGVLIAFIGAILAIIGLYMVTVSTQESY
ncbi:MAG: hypothetical protein ACTSR2_09295 [Candidatus Hodarchaeales archaeon]